MIAKIHSLYVQGLQCTPVEIEVDVAQGLPQFIIVGLPDTAVSEARDRVRSAIKQSGFTFPRTRVTVNLAPAHMKKVGSLFDLPIALGILLASGVLTRVPEEYSVGELALDGRVRGIRGALPLVYAAIHTYNRGICIPEANAQEALLLEDKRIIAVEHLSELVAHINKEKIRSSVVEDSKMLKSVQQKTLSDSAASISRSIDMKDILGQHMAKRAIEVAAAGNHNVLLFGPPGSGKSMLARALPSILPPMTQQECIEATMIQSILARPEERAGIVQHRPFRAPHHTASSVAILGGGNHIQPGEITRAHRGVLFFDELPEFRRDVLEALRQPLEEGTILIHRAHGSVQYPARCLFVGALNPCPCGFFESTIRSGKNGKKCHCSAQHIERYIKKLSGPLLDRIDIKIPVTYVHTTDEQQKQNYLSASPESSAEMQKRVIHARHIQLNRQQVTNSELDARQLSRIVALNAECKKVLHQAIQHYGLSMRAHSKILKISRTIADLAQRKEIESADITEAVRYTIAFDQQ